MLQIQALWLGRVLCAEQHVSLAEEQYPPSPFIAFPSLTKEPKEPHFCSQSPFKAQ